LNFNPLTNELFFLNGGNHIYTVYIVPKNFLNFTGKSDRLGTFIKKSIALLMKILKNFQNFEKIGGKEGVSENMKKLCGDTRTQF
jgi:hypothetical protein